MFGKKKRKEIFPPFKCIATADDELYFFDMPDEQTAKDFKETCESNMPNISIKIYKGDGEGAYQLHGEEPTRQIGFRV